MIVLTVVTSGSIRDACGLRPLKRAPAGQGASQPVRWHEAYAVQFGQLQGQVHPNTMNRARKTAPLPATNPAPGPGDFRIGSVESSAAAKMLAAKREHAKKRIEFGTSVARYTWVGDGPIPEDWRTQPRASPWNECGDCMTRIVFIPDGEAWPTS